MARLLKQLSDLLEIEGANRFRVLAYCAAARIVGDLPQEASTLIAAGKDLSELHGIGKDLAGKIGEIVQTGHLAVLEETERRIPGRSTRAADARPARPEAGQDAGTSKPWRRMGIVVSLRTVERAVAPLRRDHLIPKGKA